jgi:hypothetical protein
MFSEPEEAADRGVMPRPGEEVIVRADGFLCLAQFDGQRWFTALSRTELLEVTAWCHRDGREFRAVPMMWTRPARSACQISDPAGELGAVPANTFPLLVGQDTPSKSALEICDPQPTEEAMAF